MPRLSTGSRTSGQLTARSRPKRCKADDVEFYAFKRGDAVFSTLHTMTTAGALVDVYYRLARGV